MTEIIFRSSMTVELVQSMGDDSSVVKSARVSTVGGTSTPERDAGLINYLMKDRHGTPFEHNAFTFYIEAPIFVFREFMRHRIASYNEESGRYKELAPIFYVPKESRKLVQVGKPGSYTFEEGTYRQKKILPADIKRIATEAYSSYEKLLKEGVAREVARTVLPVGLYSSIYLLLITLSGLFHLH